MRIFLIALLFPAALAAQTCPPMADRDLEQARLMVAVKSAPNYVSSRIASNELWEFWSRAPDDAAQKMLDIGMSRRGSYDLDGAGLAFDDLIAYCPHYAEGHNQRAFIHFLREEYEAALSALERTLELAPDHIAALAGMALTLDRLGRKHASQSVLRRALILNPWLPERALLIEEPSQEL